MISGISSSRAFFLALALVVCSGNASATCGATCLTLAPSNTIALTYVSTGSGGAVVQTWATTAALVLSSGENGAGAAIDHYVQISSSQPNPAWLSVTLGGDAYAQTTAGRHPTITIAVQPGTNGANLATLTPGVNTARFRLAQSTTLTGTYVDDLEITVNLTLLATAFSASPVVITSPATTGTSTVTPAAVLGGSPAVTFAVDQLTVPAWLSSASCGTCTLVSGSGTVSLVVASNALSSFGPGNYTANIGLTSSYAEAFVSVTLYIPDASGTWFVQDGSGNRLVNGSTANLSFRPSATNPTPALGITIFGSPDPVNITSIGCAAAVKAGGDPDPAPSTTCTVQDVNGNVVTTGIAYPMGFSTVIAPNPIYFQQKIGNTISVIVTIVAPGPTTRTFEFDYLLLGGPVTIRSVFPTSARAFTTGSSLMLMVNGTNFVGPQHIASGSALQPTQVWWGDSAAHLLNPPAAANGGIILSASVTVNGAGTVLFVQVPGSVFTNRAGNVVHIGLANQTSTTALTLMPSAANGGASTTFRITANPVISAIANSASYAAPSVGTANLAPYELISLFGTFIPTTDFPAGSNNLVIALPDARFGKYSNSLPIGTRGNTLFVGFYGDAAHTQNLMPAPVLFATPGQVNAIVPGGLVPGSRYYVSVNYRTVTVTGARIDSYSDTFAVTAVAADPGVFTLSATGHGQGAILVVHSNGATPPVYTTKLNGPNSGVTALAATGDILQIYMTGLGVPDSSNPNNTDTFTDLGCIYTANSAQDPGYVDYVNGLTPGPTIPWTSIDGAIIKSAWLMGGHLPPCLGRSTLPVTVTFYDTAATPRTPVSVVADYAGFVADSVAGLYQVNVVVPDLSAFATGDLPIQVSVSNAGTSTVMGTSNLWATMKR